MPPPSRAQGATAGAAPAETARVLLVCPSDTHAASILRVLEAAGATPRRVERALDLQAAFRVAGWQRPDLILLHDSAATDPEGELAAPVAALQEIAPVILLTRRAASGALVRALQAGVADYLPDENLNPQLLERSIRRALEQARVQEPAGQEEQGYPAILDIMEEGVVLHAADGAVVTCSAAGERILGIPAARLAGGHSLFPELHATHEDGAPLLLEEEPARVALRTREPCRGRIVKFRRPDGETAWVVLNAGVIPDRATGAVRGAITVLLDVTERKSVEHRLQGAHRMEALGHLVGGVAHDFNNLLTVILGYSAFLETRLGSEHASHRDAIEIQKAGGRAASLTRQLLAFSRQHPLKPQVLDLNVVIADLGKMLRRLIGEDIELKTVLGSELGHVRADPGQIEQVIVNLVVNARDAMPQGGKLTIETANAALDTQSTGKPPGARPGAYVVLSVTDTGVGMDAVTRARMFEPFFTTKEAGEGAGLGLSTVLAIVQQCGGHLDVRSEPGVGTTFLAYLPQVTERLEAPVDATVPAYVPLGSETVMVVEDDELVRGVLRHALRRAGYSVLEAAGPEEALELFAQQAPQFQLLLADVVMPGMSGPKLVERLRAAGARCKVLYVSGYSEAAALRHGWHDAHGAFLQKPFTPEVLAAKVRELLDAAGEEGLGLGSAARSGDVEEA